MCGIAGIVALASATHAERAAEQLARMLDRLHHRGPDERGQTGDAQVWIGNTRLAVVGEDNGRQPIWNEDRDIVVVMNGEIYNAPELTAELRRRGHRFATDTDTEVLVHAYEEYGLGFLERLNGMFALAVHDRRRRQLILARDRFGMKPLYLLQSDSTPGDLAFASELNALKLVDGFSGQHSPQGLATFLGSMYVSEPFTAYRDIRALEPGCALLCSEAGQRLHRYFDMHFNPARGRAEEQRAVEAIADVLPRAVRRHLIADRPVGVLLSGGLDSRAVAAAAWREGNSGAAFTVGYREAAFDESPIAARWASALGREHHVLRLGEQQFADTVPRRYHSHGQPYAVWVNSASDALAGDIRARGYKAVLSGEGGDELFCGYPTLHAANLARAYRHLPGPLRRLIARASDALPAGGGRLPLAFMAQSFAKSVSRDLIRSFYGFKEVIRYRDWREALTPEAFAMLGEIDPALAFEQYRERIGDWPLIDQLSYIDIKSFLSSCSLVPNDNAFMANSVETRVPLLDLELVELVQTLPLGVRFHATEPKRLLKKSLDHYLRQHAPEALQALGKYKKMGFEVPTSAWVDGPAFGPVVERYLGREQVERVGFFNPDYIDRVRREQREGKQNNERILQTAMAMQHFLDA